MARVVDRDGNVREWLWLRQLFGRVDHLEAGTSPRFVLGEVQVTQGPAAIVVRVEDDHGAPLANTAVAFSWPDGPVDLAAPECAAFRSKWHQQCVVQWTDGDGYTGFGVGPGGCIRNLDEGGPHAVWVLHDRYESDCLDRIGWLGGTDHLMPGRVRFIRGDAAVPEEPEEPPAGGWADVLAELRAVRSALEGLARHLGVG